MSKIHYARFQQDGKIVMVGTGNSETLALSADDFGPDLDIDIHDGSVSTKTHYRDIEVNEFKTRQPLEFDQEQTGKHVTFQTPENVSVMITGPVFIPPTLIEDGDIELEFIEPGDYVIHLETVAHLPEQVTIHVD